MFFDIGWSELLLIGAIALVVIGPKDLPRALRVAGYWFRKARTMSAEFQSTVEQMIRDAELDDMRQDMAKLTSLDVTRELENRIDPDGSLTRSLAPPGAPDFLSPPEYVEPTEAGSAVAEIETAPLLPPPAELAPALPVAEPPPEHGFEAAASEASR